MKNALVLITALLLGGCFSDHNPETPALNPDNGGHPDEGNKPGDGTNPDDGNNPGEGTNPDHSIKIPELLVNRNNSSIILTWSAPPKIWKAFRLCEKGAANTDAACKQSGQISLTRKGFDIVLTLGAKPDEFSVEEMLTDDFQLRFYQTAEDGATPVHSINLNDAENNAPIKALLENSIQYFKASKTQAEDLFGQAVAVSQDGQIMVVGAPNQDSFSADLSDERRSTNSGAVFVYAYSKTEQKWQQVDFLKASTINAGDNFGADVAMSNDGSVIAVGVPGEDSSATGANGAEANDDRPRSGAMIIFEKNAENKWRKTAFLKAQTSENGAQMGSVVALSGDGKTAAFASSQNAKAVNVFIKGKINAELQENWQYFDSLTAPAANRHWGKDLSFNLNASVLAVSETAATGLGKIYTFERSNNHYSNANFSELSNSNAGAGFGSSIALSLKGDVLAVGNSTGGGIYIYDYNDESHSNKSWQSRVEITTNNPNSGFGEKISLSADGSRLALFSAKTKDTHLNAPGISSSTPQGNSFEAGGISLYRLEKNSFSQILFYQPKTFVKYTGFGSGLAMSGDGTVLVGATGYEQSDATGINNEQSATESSKENSGAAWMLNLGGEKLTVEGEPVGPDAAIPEFPQNLPISQTVVDKKMIKISWDGDAIPFWTTAFRLCKQGASSCDLATGDAQSGGAQFSLEYGKDNLTDLFDATYELRFTDNNGNVIKTINFNLSSEAINSSILYIKAKVSSVNDHFGYAVASSEDGKTIAIGLPGQDSSNPSLSDVDLASFNSGAVIIYSYVETGANKGWNAEAIKADTIDANDEFGRSLAISDDGNTLVVGAPYESSNATGVAGDQSNNGMEKSGAVLVFARASRAHTWEQVAYLKSSSSEGNLNFGTQVAISGDGSTIAASSALNKKAVNTFVKVENNWLVFDEIVPPSQLSDKHIFGTSLSFNRNSYLLAIGNTLAKPVSGSNEYVAIYEKTASAYASALTLQSNSSGFGEAIDFSASGKKIAIGLASNDSVYVYSIERENGVLDVKGAINLKAPTGLNNKNFGKNIKLSDDGKRLAVYTEQTTKTPKGLEKTSPTGDESSTMGGITVFDIGDKAADSKEKFYFQPIAQPNSTYSEFGSVLALSGDGSTLVGATKNENNNATGINGESAGANKNYSGAAWLVYIGEASPFVGSGDDLGTAPKPVFPTFPEGLVAKAAEKLEGSARATGKIEITWDTSEIPDTVKSFKLCLRDALGDCQSIPISKNSDGSLSFVLGNGVSIEDLLSALNDNEGSKFYIEFFDTLGSLIGSASVEITQELINSTVQYIKASNTGANDKFGTDVGLSANGKILVIGAPNEDSGSSTDFSLVSTDSGAVYVFTQDENGWRQSAFIKHPFPDANDNFGQRVVISDDGLTIAVSMPNDDSEFPLSYDEPADGILDNNGSTNTGAVLVYNREIGSDEWQLKAFLKNESTDIANLKMGLSDLAMSGDGNSIVVSLENKEASSFFVRETNLDLWQARFPVFGVNEGTKEDDVGFSLSLNQYGDDSENSVLAIGLPGNSSSDTTNPNANDALPNSGGVFILTGRGFVSSRAKFIKPAGLLTNQRFGRSVSLSAQGDVLAVGGLENKVYLFDRQGDDWVERYQSPLTAPELRSFGVNIELSKDGKMLAVHSILSKLMPGINGEVTNAAVNFTNGVVSVYELTTGNSAPTEPKYILQNLYPADSTDFGRALSFSKTGKSLVVTGPFEKSGSTGINGNENNTSASSSGAAWLYKFDNETAENF